MAGKTLDVKEIIVEDQLGVVIARLFHQWHIMRQPWVRDMEELQRYIYATDTTQTTNSRLPWKNKTTTPKLCQIRDNLLANYVASIFPKRKFLDWIAASKDSNGQEKRAAIVNYMTWAVSQPAFKQEFIKCVMDYIDYGNCFAMPVWIDERVELEDKTQVGYVGPGMQRINPIDLVMNPVAPEFRNTPKIVRSLISMGEVKDLLTKLSTPENQEEYELLWEYLRTIRYTTRITGGDLRTYDDFFNVAGFTNFQMYLQSDYVEVLTFYGDIYDRYADVFYKNYQIMVVDRHKIIGMKPNPSWFGRAPIEHAVWRKRQDNLWGMGPLNNLVGLQYRLDHVENLKADVFDLNTFPPLKVKGYVEEFEWGPFERIYIGDDGDVEPIPPAWNVLTANMELDRLTATMEEMAGSPKEAMGFRSPGEKTAYEVQRIENAWSRLYQNKISQLEEYFFEPLMNGMLECARRNLREPQTITVFDDEFKIQTFMTLTPNDLTGMGRIRPLAARHYAEKAEIVQNLNTFYQSAIGQDQDIKAHFASIKLARMMEDLLDLQDYELVTPYIRLAEHADAQRLAQSAAEQVMRELQTPAGLQPDDYNPQKLAALTGGAAPQGPQAPQMPGTAPAGPPAQVPNIGPLGPGNMMEKPQNAR